MRPSRVLWLTGLCHALEVLSFKAKLPGARSLLTAGLKPRPPQIRTALWDVIMRRHYGTTLWDDVMGRYDGRHQLRGMGQPLKITLTNPTVERRAEFLAAAARSRKLHGLWTSAPRTAKDFDKYVKRFTSSDNQIGFWILTENREIAGVVNISEIVRGRFRSGYLGYYALAPHDGRGYMTMGLRAAVSQAFRSLALHRLEANIQPGNEKSRQLARRLGFKKEGYSPRYLKIAGQWRDHERWAITAEDWKQFLRSKPQHKKKKSA